MWPELPALPPAPRRWPWLALLAALALLQCLLFGWRQQQQRLYATTGLRFASALEERALDAILEAQADTAEDEAIFASFWGQQTGAVLTENGRAAKDVYCIGYCGDARDCLPVSYCAGTAPGQFGKTCALSTGLAQALFGSDEAVGLTVIWQGEHYTVFGVFPAQDAVLLYPDRENLTCAELRNVSPDAPKADVQRWCTAYGLPAPQAILYGPQRIWAADGLCRLPLILVGAALGVCLLRLTLDWPPWVRGAVWFVLALAAALWLPHFLEGLPGWLIPARWSDFSFWTNLGTAIRQSGRAWAESPRFWRDYGPL